MLYDFYKNQFIQTSELSDNAFIVGTDVTLTEKDADELHQKLKLILLDLKIPSGHPICIYGEKEAMFPVVMITLISLNIPYIPIDAIMPMGRVKNIQEQTQSKVLINCSSKKCDVEFDILITKQLEVISQNRIFKYDIINNGNDPVRYILFTSGSTGVPKGVQITASALTNFIEWYVTWPGINKHTVFMNQAPFSFDVSLCDFIGAYACGSKIILNDYAILKSGNLFLERLKLYEATTIICTPAFIKMYISIPEFNTQNYPQVQQFVFMGEELPASTVKKIKHVFPQAKVVNAFGPTEATVVVTYIEITEEILINHSKSLPIGYCKPNSEIVILNKDYESGIGEIGLIGNNLSIGYFNDVEKTKQAFIIENEKRIYKTGDVGYINDNLIFYLGRNDNQVKLNGYRIELEEISNVLLTHPSVLNASTVPLTAGGITKKIISFLLLKNDLKEENYSEILKTFLQNNLPSYMIPSEFIVMDEFPLNSNYKTDKKMLLEGYLNRN